MSAVLEHIRVELADAKLNLQLALQQRDRHSINKWKHRIAELKRTIYKRKKYDKAG